MQHQRKSSAPIAAPAIPSPTSVIVVAYEYPSSAKVWAPVIAAKQANPTVNVIAIVNPDSGPGTAIDPNYTTAIAALKAAGVIVYGYVHTSYGAILPATIEAQLREWAEWYAPSGMFFDEMANTPGFESYYSGLTAYAASLGIESTIGNPGADTLPAYVGTVDTIVIYEDDGLPAASFLGGWHASYPKSNFAFIAYGVASLNTATEQSLSSYVGSLYITSKKGSDPYNALPSYLAAEVSALA